MFTKCENIRLENGLVSDIRNDVLDCNGIKTLTFDDVTIVCKCINDRPSGMCLFEHKSGSKGVNKIINYKNGEPIFEGETKNLTDEEYYALLEELKNTVEK